MRRLFGVARVSLPLLRHGSGAFSKLEKQLDDLKLSVADIGESRSLEALVAFYGSRRLHRINNLGEVVHHRLNLSYNRNVFCHLELPVLLSHLIGAIDTFPCGLNAISPILLVKNTYLNSFKELVRCEFPDTEERALRFRNVVAEIEEAHAKRDILCTMARGLLELKELLWRHRRFILSEKKTTQTTTTDETLHEQLVELTQPMDEFSLRMVHYNFLSRMLLNLDDEQENMVGMVELQMDLEKVVRNAVDDAKEVCIAHYGDCPDVRFIISKDVQMMKFLHMSTMISYIIIELMKNAFRATVEAHMTRNALGMVDCNNMPPVEVLVNVKEHAKHACICISDEGMGMTRTQSEMAMTYAYTSAKRPLLEDDNGDGDHEHEKRDTVAALAGYGFGLPMSRVYARAFDGDLVVNTMEGYGTRVYYYIKL